MKPPKEKDNPWHDVNLKDPEHMQLFLCIQDVSLRLAALCAWVKVFKWLMPLIFAMILALLGLEVSNK